uniref:Saposin B-type domain-containing protein n=1 Tax=Lates calcarifer TaxID=8187 RepID=A0A4W6F1R9_LATCA
METSSVLLVCLLVTCSVLTVHGRSFEVNIDDEEQVDVEISVGARKIPGLCWACKWALNKVKKVLGPNATSEVKQSSACHKFVKTHLGELIEELTTSDDVRTICVNTGACKPKELLNELFYLGDEYPQIKMKKFP